VPHYHATSDVLAVPSAYDPHPLVVTEGACFGLPVLASDAIGRIGPTYTAQPGVNALVYRCGDGARSLGLIGDLASEPDLRGHLGKASWDIAGRHDARHAASLLARAVGDLAAAGRR
jgi:hypothetical protein